MLASNDPTQTTPYSLVAADFDGDGKLDLAVTSKVNRSVKVLQNLGGGLFGAASIVVADYQPAGIASADLDGDSKPDIVTANLGGTMSVLLNNCQ